MHSPTKKNHAVLLILIFALSSCGVSDYINRKKISSAPVYKEAPKTSQCEFNEFRIKRVIKYINDYRASPRACGGKTYPAATAVTWNTHLEKAALNHSQDMAKNNFFSHEGSTGSSVGDRAEQAKYKWQTVAENISAGTETPEQTIDRWIASPGHCYNIMNNAHIEIGMSCVINPLSDYQVYWTLVLASPAH